MRRDEPQLTAARLAVVLIGLGTPEEAAEFREKLRLPFPILSDPEQASYAHYGLLRMSLGREAGAAHALDSARHFFTDIARYGGAYSAHQDMAQLGGVFLVDPSGVIQFAFRARRTSEHPRTAQLIRAVRGAPA